MRNSFKKVCVTGLTLSGMRNIYAGAFSGCSSLTELICGKDVELSADVGSSEI